jgi:hypothetical protein
MEWARDMGLPGRPLLEYHVGMHCAESRSFPAATWPPPPCQLPSREEVTVQVSIKTVLHQSGSTSPGSTSVEVSGRCLGLNALLAQALAARQLTHEVKERAGEMMQALLRFGRAIAYAEGGAA